MRRIIQTISWLALAGTFLSPVLFFAGMIDLEQSKRILLLATIIWFVHTPMWMGREPEKPDTATIP
ncbi:hypothetical protein [Gimesia aquarii]|uniref:Uncharacterized protein n=1 Tax=Gimesia aquarii TaxID=2527964 RepID=A0A517VUE0_9PLAN|nr:hypothetical protein [Gimesia aquarii]QDT96617.1 hypothetical protein V144x_20750 [Gimesia aquarii]